MIRNFETDPLRVVALCKTFRGEEFVEAMLESLYNQVDAIVFVDSDVSWTGERGNTVRRVVEEWKVKNDSLNKIRQFWYDTRDQNVQYAVGFAYIKNNFNADFVMLVDTDEIWEEEDIQKCKQFLIRTDFNAYTVNMRTYIKSPFYRLKNIEPCQPTVFLKASCPSIDGVRGNGIHPRTNIPDVYMHHFTYVRTREQIIEKVKATTQADGLNVINLDEWIKEKWDRLPNPSITNLHTSKGYEHYWQGVEVIGKKDLPSVFHKHTFDIIRTYYNDDEQDITKRHEKAFEVIKNTPSDMNLDERKKSFEFALIKEYTKPEDCVLEIGCLTGQNILNLFRYCYHGKRLGIEMIGECVEWADKKAKEIGDSQVHFYHGIFPTTVSFNSIADKIVIFDVLEHIENVGIFLTKVKENLKDDGEVLILVPKAKFHYDPVHINFYPDLECLRNLVTMHFKVIEMKEMHNKLFARLAK